MRLTFKWQKYNGDYEKMVQDIRLKNGDIVYFCYPNAGSWNVLVRKDNGKYYDTLIPNNDVEYVRKNKEFYKL